MPPKSRPSSRAAAIDAARAARAAPPEIEINPIVPVKSAIAVTPLEMLNDAVQGGADPEVLNRLMDLYERWEKGNARKAFDNAIADAKALIPTIQKTKHVQFPSKSDKPGGGTDFWHEGLDDIAEAINPILSKHGLSYRYRSVQTGDKLKIICVVSHRDGYFDETELESGMDLSGSKNPIQGLSSAATYLQRYTLKLALGLAVGKDDDAKAAGQAKTISAEQAEAIEAKIKETGANRARFLSHYKIEKLEDLDADKFQGALMALASAAKARAKAKEQG